MKFYNKESEQVVIASMLLNEESLLTCLNTINDSIFYDELLKKIYSVIINSYRKYSSIMLPSSVKKIVEDKHLSLKIKKRCSFLIKKYNEKSFDKIEFTVALDEIKGLYIKRELVSMLGSVVDNIEENDVNNLYLKIEDFIADTKTFMNSSELTREGGVDDFDNRIERYNAIKDNPDMFRGIRSGWTELDFLTGGFQPGELVLIMAKPGGGKSMGLLNCAYSAWEDGKNVVYFSLEMPKEQIERRFDSRLSSVEYFKIKTGSLTNEEMETISVSMKDKIRDKKNNFYIVDVPSGCNSAMISSKLNQIKNRFNVDIVVVDYLGLVDPMTRARDLWQKTLDSANELKEVARKFNVPLLTASQVTSEGMKKKANKELDLSDVALTRRLADPCDIVLGLQWDKDVGQVYINIAKYRDGTGPVIRLFADMDRCLITNLEYGIEQ